MANFYGDRYAKMYAPLRQSLRRSAPTPVSEAEDQQSAKSANFWSGLGSAMPALGAAGGGALGGVMGGIVGGPAGATAGAGMGAGLGSALYGVPAQGLENFGEEQLDPARRRELRRQALIQALRGSR